MIIPLNWHQKAETMLSVHRLVMLVGEPGIGKTLWAMNAARTRTGNDAEMLQGTPETEMNHFWGVYALTDGNTQFCDGPLPRALKKNRYLVIEEFNLIPLESRASLLSLRGQSRITNPFTGEEIQIPETFRLIATSNPESIKCRKNTKISQALLDDFLILEVENMENKDIQKMLATEFPQAKPEVLKEAMGLWKQFSTVSTGGENGIRLSYRAAQHLMKLMMAGLDRESAMRIALVNKFISDEDAFGAAKVAASIT